MDIILVVLGLFFGSIILVYWDAKANKIRWWPHLPWVFSCGPIAWIIIFPLYLFKRDSLIQKAKENPYKTKRVGFKILLLVAFFSIIMLAIWSTTKPAADEFPVLDKEIFGIKLGENADEFPVLDKEIFGIKLGENTEDVKKRYKLTKQMIADWDYESEMIQINDYNYASQSVSLTGFIAFKEQVATIWIFLADNSETNYKGTVKRLEDKYKIVKSVQVYPTDSAIQSGFINKDLSAHELLVDIDNEPVLISIRRSVYAGFYHYLSLKYSHVRMERAYWKYEEQKKSADVADGL